MPGAPTDDAGYLHEAVLYDSDEEFLGVVVPFLQEGAAVGEPCLVALESSTTDPTAPSTLPVEAPPPATPQRETPPLDATDIEHLVFAVSEGVTNAVTHGRPRSGSACGARRTAMWPPSPTAMTDLPTRSPVSDICSAGLGLWLTHRLCSHVTLDTTDNGFTIRLVVGTAQPGRSGHASNTA